MHKKTEPFAAKQFRYVQDNPTPRDRDSPRISL